MNNEKQHATLSPSGADTWMLCPGAAAMQKSYPRESTQYSAEGTAAHTLAAWCLETGQDASSYAGRIIEADGYQFEVDEEMVEAVNLYVSYVHSYIDTAADDTLLIEQELSIETLTGEPGAIGTSDCVGLHADNERITVIDLKYGRGNRVDACGNRQLQIYALAALREFGILADFRSVTMVIVQPRLNHISDWTVSVAELERFALTVKERAKHALNVIECEDPGAYYAHLVAGDVQCKWCKAKADCPKIRAVIGDTTGANFEDLDQAELPPAGELHPLTAQMAKIDLIEDWCKAVRAAVERELLAGRGVPGWKLVEGRRGPRAWTATEEAEKVMQSMRLKKEEMYSFKLITPTQAEKLLHDSPKRWSRLQELISQPEGRPSVAPDSDKRPALVVTPVEDAFDDLSLAEDLV